MIKRFFALFLFSLLAVNANADSTLVSYGGSWKYFDSGFLPSLLWADSSYDDSAWQSGNAEFGYGDGDETTVVSYGSNAANKYITTYFRKAITVTNISLYTSFQVNIKRDDGAVVYVNGLEVFRTNMPSGTIEDTTLASTFANDDGDTPQTFLLPASAFTEGLNMVAVEVHQSDNTSTDLSFDMELNALGFYIPLLLRQPYLQMLSPDAINIKWRTDVATFSKVCYSVNADSLDFCVTDSSATIDHEVRLTGLTPSTKYFYSIGDGSNILQSDSSNYFVTSPLAGSAKHTRVWIISDPGVNTVEQNNVRDAFLTYNNDQPVDFMLMLGDNAYNLGNDQEYQDAMFQNHYEEIIKNTPVFSTAGNHENYSADALTQTGPYYDIFSLPKNGEIGGVASGSEAYYSFDYGSIHFVCLESNTASLRLAGSDMLTWLQNDLSATNQKWKVVYFHNPPYTKGGHNSDGEADLIEIRQNIVPVLEQYKTDLVMNGHSHVYERSNLLYGHYGFSTTLDSSMIVDTAFGTLPYPLFKRSQNDYKGTVYVQAGVSGVVESIQPDWPHPAMKFVDNVNMGSLFLDVDADTLTLKFIDSDVSNPHVLDNFSIVKKCDVTPTINPLVKMCSTATPVVLSGTPAGGIFTGAGVTDSLFNPNAAGGGSHTVTYTYSDNFACNVSATTQVEVVATVPAQPSAINGPSLVCPPVNGLSLNIPSQPDADSYQWNVDPGTNGITLLNPLNDTSITFNVTTPYPSYIISVTAYNTCGASIASDITMNRVKNFPVVPYGNTFACPLDTMVYSTYGLNALATLTWSAPIGSIINNQQQPLTTLAVTQVNITFPAGFTSGNVCVANHPACLQNVNVRCVHVSSNPAQPGYIQGVNGVIPGTTGVSFSANPVIDATGYIWTLPANTILVSGQNTTTITVDFTASYVGGLISVKALSDCGESANSSKLVKVFTMFSGSVNANVDRTVNTTNTEETESPSGISVFPNPVENLLSIQFTGENNSEPFEIVLTDMRGKKVYSSSGKLEGRNFSQSIPVATLADGVYFLKITTLTQQHYQRIIKR